MSVCNMSLINEPDVREESIINESFCWEHEAQLRRLKTRHTECKRYIYTLFFIPDNFDADGVSENCFNCAQLPQRKVFL